MPNSLAVSYDTIRRAIGLSASLGRNYSTWSTTVAADVDSFISDALNRVYFDARLPGETEAHAWSFLRAVDSITTVASTSTYDLPENFGDLLGRGFTFAADANQAPIAVVQDFELRAIVAQGSRSGAPKYCAVRPKAAVPGGETKYEVVFYPTPDAAYVLSFRYGIIPPMISSANPYPMGGAIHGSMIKAACCAQAEIELGDAEAVWGKRYLELLASSIALDTKLAASVESEAWPLEDPSSGLTINRAYLRRLIGNKMGFGPHRSVWNHRQSEEIKLVLETALRNFYSPVVLPGEKYPHDWSFLRPSVPMSTVSGVYAYDLPDGFVSFIGRINYASDSSAMYRPIEIIGVERIQLRLQRNEAAGRPSLAAYQIKAPDPAVGTRYELLLWPVPDGSYDLSARMQINPHSLGEEAEFPLGGQQHAQTLIEACLAAADQYQGTKGPHVAEFMQRLVASVGADRKNSAPQYLGQNIDRSDMPRDEYFSHHDCDENIVTYNGQSY